MKKSTLEYALNVIRNQQKFVSSTQSASQRKEQAAFAKGLTTMLELILTEGYSKPLGISLSAREVTDADWAALNDQARIDLTTTL